MVVETRSVKHLGGARMEARFIAGDRGDWRVLTCAGVVGPSLAPARRLAVVEGGASAPSGVWELRGVTSYERYVNAAERTQLVERQRELGRPEATRAALIPISKSPEWWSLAADERRAIFEETSHHVAQGMQVLPSVARRLYHGRDAGEEFDFLTWFEYAADDGERFERLVADLRGTPEWRYVIREVDIRLEREWH